MEDSASVLGFLVFLRPLLVGLGSVLSAPSVSSSLSFLGFLGAAFRFFGAGPSSSLSLEFDSSLT